MLNEPKSPGNPGPILSIKVHIEHMNIQIFGQILVIGDRFIIGNGLIFE
jgi:hypothetical protein